MPIPNYQQFMNPVLQLYAENKDKQLKTSYIAEKAADILKLTPEERSEMIRSGRRTIVFDRSYWATLYMYNAGLLSRPDYGFYQITEEGLKVYREGCPITNDLLMNYKSFVNFFQRVRRSSAEAAAAVKETAADSPANDPQTRIEQALAELEEVFKNDLLSLVKNLSPQQFEQLVVSLMVKMGYGEGKVTRYNHDGGIDGVINEDELGLSKIYLQAKKYTKDNVQAPDIDQFIGALATRPQAASRGVFITTTGFSAGARENVETNKHYIIRLIDGDELVKLMIKHNLGVRTVRNGLEIKEVDSAFFNE
jgi:restriction system protein